ncbi:hypothetical protein MMC28_009525 [Mycoblastus sanguinarius]|nr:hypothetical protein [Mycoblastus sanguinarius]
MTVSQVQSFMFLLWVLFLGFRVVEAAALSSQRVDTLDNTTYAESLGDTTSNVSLETAAESLWDSPSGDSPSNLLTLATTGSLLSANQSVISQKLSAGVWKCEGNTFGYNLNGDSCYNALSASLLEWKDTNIKTWGPRNTGVQYDFTIPRRYVSRDGTCIIGPHVGPRFTSARGSQQDVAIAAAELINQCVNKNPSEGGLAKDIGDGKLGVYVAKQEPNVRCYIGVQAFHIDCLNMSYDTTPTLEENELTLEIIGWEVLHAGPTDTTAWLRIWEYGSAVTAMCAAQGKKGVWTQIGE